MKQNILSLLFSGLVLIATACSSEISNDPDSPKTTGESILQLEINKEDLTRSGLESTTFDEGDEVFVVVSDRNNPEALTDTTKATYTDGRWLLSSKIDLASEVDGVTWSIADVEVYYPYSIIAEAYDTKNTQIIIIEDPLSQIDLLCGKTYGITKDYPTAKVECQHLKTRLTFGLENNSDKPIGITKISVSTEGEQLFLGRYGYIQNGYFYIPDEFTETYSMGCNIEIPVGETANLDLLLPPTEQAYEWMDIKMAEEGISKTILKFALDVGDRTVNFDIDAKPWAPGRQYTYPVNISEPYKPDPDDFEYVDLGLSVLWASCNVGASNIEDTGKFFFWGGTRGYDKNETYSAETVSFVDYKSIDQLLEANIIELVPDADDKEWKYSLTPNYDAATKNMGDPWRMPTADEFKELMDNTSFECVKINDEWMFKYSSKISGYEDKYIIFPCPWGMFQLQNGTYKFFERQKNNYPSGDWWCSSVPNDYPDRGMLLEIVNNQYSSAWLWLRSLTRGMGFNVRAVRPKL